MRAVEKTSAGTATHGATLVRHGPPHRVTLAGLVVVAVLGVAAADCGGADAPPVETGGAALQVAQPEAADPPAVAPPTGDPSADPAQDGVVPAPEFPAPPAPALPLELSSPEHQRYQQLRLETLRSMIDAAKLALPIGPFQQRIDAAARIALEDVSEAGDLMEQIVADLREAIAAAGR